MKEIREGKKAKDRKLIGRKESWGVGSVGGMECGGDGRREGVQRYGISGRSCTGRPGRRGVFLRGEICGAGA